MSYPALAEGLVNMDTIKDVGQKFKERVLQKKQESFPKLSSAKKKSHQRDKHLGSPPKKILKTILKMDQGRTPTNGPNQEKINDYAQGFTIR